MKQNCLHRRKLLELSSKLAVFVFDRERRIPSFGSPTNDLLMCSDAGARENGIKTTEYLTER